MSSIIYIAAGIQLAFGVYAVALGRNAVNEVTAAICIGFGVVALALARMLQVREGDDLRRASADDKAKWDAKNIR